MTADLEGRSEAAAEAAAAEAAAEAAEAAEAAAAEAAAEAAEAAEAAAAEAAEAAAERAAARVVIVTGAASGVGRAAVERFRADGASVVAVDRSEAVRTEFAGDDGVRPVVGDVAEPATAEQAVATALEAFGHIDVLVNNAARFLLKPLADTTVEEWDGLMRTNARGVFLFSRAVLPAMTAAGSGSIVNVASISGLVGLANQVAYGATKGAIVTFTKALAVEVAALGIRVNVIAPGTIDTPFVREPLAALPDPEGTMRAIEATHPMRRIAQPSEIADAVAYLASPAASFVTGVVLPVDGGYTAQ
jgi:NAD(P)-dependent dehydrogenase (short-subunit alcohol dehydrogenase family)